MPASASQCSFNYPIRSSHQSRLAVGMRKGSIRDICLLPVGEANWWATSCSARARSSSASVLCKPSRSAQQPWSRRVPTPEERFGREAHAGCRRRPRRPARVGRRPGRRGPRVARAGRSTPRTRLRRRQRPRSERPSSGCSGGRRPIPGRRDRVLTNCDGSAGHRKRVDAPLRPCRAPLIAPGR